MEFKPTTLPNAVFLSQPRFLRDSSGHVIALLQKVDIYRAIKLEWCSSDQRIFYIFSNDLSTWISPSDHLYTNIYQEILNDFFNSTLNRKSAITLPAPQFDGKQAGKIVVEWASRGPFSFHFGHFIIDTLPCLVLSKQMPDIFNEGTFRLWLRRLKPWASELIEMAGIQLDAKALIHPRFQELPIARQATHVSKLSIVIDTPSYFLKLSKTYKESVLRTGFSNILLDRAVPTVNPKRLLVLSRGGLTAGKSRRWSNEKECVSSLNDFHVDVIEPEKYGPKALFGSIATLRPAIVLAAHGSALHQLLIYTNVAASVVMLCPSVLLERSTKSHLSDFRYATERLHLVSFPSQTVDWNANFWVDPDDLAQCLQFIASSTMPKSLPISIGSLVFYPPGSW